MSVLLIYAVKLKASNIILIVCLSIKDCECVCARACQRVCVSVPVHFMSAPKWNVFACVCCHANSRTMLSILWQCNGWKHARCVYAHWSL